MSLELLNVQEVMKLLKVSRDTVYRLIADGELRSLKIGRSWRFTRIELEQFVRHQTEKCGRKLQQQTESQT